MLLCNKKLPRPDLSKPATISASLQTACDVIRAGGVIAYPTEYCFGIGCDPMQAEAVHRVLAIKRRSMDKGMILLAGNWQQVYEIADYDSVVQKKEIEASWPGATTWVMPSMASVPAWIRGLYSTVAVRYTAFNVAQELCQQFGHAIVSSSANRAQHEPLRTVSEVKAEFANDVDFILDKLVGGAQAVSSIRDATTGERLR